MAVNSKGEGSHRGQKSAGFDAKISMFIAKSSKLFSRGLAAKVCASVWKMWSEFPKSQRSEGSA